MTGKRTKRPSRPRLTLAVVEGLRACASIAQVTIETGDGAVTERDRMKRGVEYLYRLCDWYENGRKS